ncbi:MAG: hypothetical protein WAU70_04890 [Flavobacteriales bacterium]
MLEWFLKHNGWIIALLGAIGFVVAVFLGADPELMRASMLIAFVVVLGVVGYGWRAFRSYDKRRPPPFPKSFWGLIFNRLQPIEGVSYSEHVTRITIIDSYDNPYSRESAVRMKESFQKLDNVFIDCFHYRKDHVANEQRLTLMNLLDHTSGVIIHRINDFKEVPWLHTCINDWASRESHLPCFVLDLKPTAETDVETADIFINGDNRNTYHFISEADSDELPWRFLTRATERSLGWRIQATWNRRYAFATAFAVLALAIGSLLMFRRAGDTMNAEVNGFKQYVASSITKQSDLVFSLVADTNQSCEVVLKAMSNYARLVTRDYAQMIGMPDSAEKLGVSIWRIDSIQGRRKVYQLAWDDGDNDPDRKIWNYDPRHNIISAAFENPNTMILWRDSMSDGEAAAWPLSGGTALATWNARASAIEFTATKKQVQYLVRHKSSHRALLCGTTAPTDSLTNDICGVCIVSKLKDSGFLMAPESKEVLTAILQSTTRIHEKSQPNCGLEEYFESSSQSAPAPTGH